MEKLTNLIILKDHKHPR